jgi:hypothetical protein
MIFMHGLCHDEVRILIFDDPGEQERSQLTKFVPLKSTLSKSKSSSGFGMWIQNHAHGMRLNLL